MPWPKGKSTNHLRVWTKEQEDIVIKKYDGNGSSLENVLPFSASAIRNKAKRLGIQNTKHHHHVTKTPLPEMRPIDLAYIGGFFDGEGSIYHNSKKIIQYRIAIGNSNEKVIRWIHETIGMGKIRIFKPRKNQHLPSYVWYVERQGDVWAFLEIIYPFLHVKRAEAVEALDYLDFRHSTRLESTLTMF